MRVRILIFILIGLLLLTGCNQTQPHFSDTKATNNPTAREILTENPNADIFQLEGIVYVNASNIEWVQKEVLTIGEKVGTITKRNKDAMTFENGMATHLPVGTEIFRPMEKSGAILIVKLNGYEIRYLGLIEG
jgi:hypothetical protein